MTILHDEKFTAVRGKTGLMKLKSNKLRGAVATLHYGHMHAGLLSAAPGLLEACREILTLIDTNIVFPLPKGWETLTWEEKLDHPRSRIYDKMQAAIQSCRQDGGGVEK